MGSRDAGRANVGLIVLVAVVGLLLIGSWLYISSRSGNPEIQIMPGFGSIVDKKMKFVVFAVKDIPEGSIITKGDLDDKPIDESKASSDAVGSIEECEGHVAVAEIKSGQVIMKNDLGSKNHSIRKSFILHHRR